MYIQFMLRFTFIPLSIINFVTFNLIIFLQTEEF